MQNFPTIFAKKKSSFSSRLCLLDVISLCAVGAVEPRGAHKKKLLNF